MPRGDRTGPRGMGPLTGRRAGYCAGYDQPGYANPGPGYGYGYGMGGGRGRGWHHRHWFRATGVPGWARFGAPPAWGDPWGAPPTREELREQETEALRQEAEWIEDRLGAIRERLDDLSRGSTE